MNEALEIGHAHADKGRWEEAVEAFHEALKEEPQNLDVRGYIIAICAKCGTWSEVIHQHMECAKILRQKNDLPSAVERYREILRIEELFESQELSLEADEMAQAREYIKRVKPGICFQTGGYFLTRNEAGRAVQYLRKSLELWPGRWETHMSLGKAYMRLARDEEAIEQFSEVSRLAPLEAAPAYEMLGEIFAAQKGRSVHRTIVWFQHAGDTYLRRQHLTDAARMYRRMLDLVPDNQDALTALNRLNPNPNQMNQAPPG